MIKLSKFGLAKLLLWGTLAVVLSQPVFGTTAWVTPPDDFQNIQIGAEYTEAGTAETTVHPNSGSLDLTNINNYEFEHVPNVADIKKNFYVEFMIKTSSQAGPANFMDGINEGVVTLTKTINATSFVPSSTDKEYLINTDGPLAFFGSEDEDSIYSYIRLDHVKMYYISDIAGRRVSPASNYQMFTSTSSAPVNTIISTKKEGASDAVLPKLNNQKITKIKIKISYPPLLAYTGVSNKYGIKIFGLDCPASINPIFYRVAPGQTKAISTQITGTSISILRGSPIAGFIYQYDTYNQGISVVTDIIPTNITDADEYTYKYYYQYIWDGAVVTYSPLQEPPSTAGITEIEDNAFQVIFSRNQAAVSGSEPTW